MEKIVINLSNGNIETHPLTPEEEAEVLERISNNFIPVYSCTPWQIRKALNNQNLREAVETAIATSNDRTLKDGWEFATEFRTDDPFVQAMGSSLGKTQQELIELIQYASTT